MLKWISARRMNLIDATALALAGVLGSQERWLAALLTMLVGACVSIAIEYRYHREYFE